MNHQSSRICWYHDQWCQQLWWCYLVSDDVTIWDIMHHHHCWHHHHLIWWCWWFEIWLIHHLYFITHKVTSNWMTPMADLNNTWMVYTSLILTSSSSYMIMIMVRCMDEQLCLWTKIYGYYNVTLKYYLYYLCMYWYKSYSFILPEYHLM